MSGVLSNPLPYSLPQKEIWAEWLAWSDATHLNIGGFSKLQGPLSHDLMKQSLMMLVSENDALRLVPNTAGDQILLDTYEPSLVVQDFTDETDPHQKAVDWQQEWMQAAFEDSSVPPIRYALLQVEPEFHYLVIQSSHMIMDGWSLSIAPQKWAECYRRLLNSNRAQGETAPHYPSYQDYIQDSLKYPESKSYIRDQAFWENKLPELKETLFTKKYSTSKQLDQELSLAFINYHHINDDVRQSVFDFAKHADATAFQVYMAALALYLFDCLSVDELIIGIPALNRGGNKYKNTLGMFVGVLPITIRRPESSDFIDLVNHVKTELVASYRHAKLPLSEQFKRLKAVNKGRDRLFDVIFSYEVFEFTSQFGEAILSDTKQTFSKYSRFPMAISLCDFVDAQDTEVIIECSDRYFSEAEADLVGARLVNLLKQLCGEQKAATEVSMCTPNELAKLSVLPPLVPQEKKISFIDLVLSHAKVAPKHVALVTQDAQYNYQEMVNSAVNLAQVLQSHDVKKGDHVILALHRGPEVIVSILACGFIGATFIPIDLDWPLSRVRSIAQQAKPTALLVNDLNLSRYAELDICSLVIDIPVLLSKRADLQRLDEYRRYKDVAAYMLFTSGSTGEPKGVVVGHQALLARLNWLAEAWGLTAKDRSLQATQINFDPALVELLGPLYAGGSVAFPPSGRLLPEWLPAYISQFNATFMAFVPSTLRRFLDGLEPNQILPLRVCCCGGEVLSYDIAHDFIRLTNANLYNVYGPTEATIFCTAWQVHPHQVTSTAMPVGKPLFGSKIYIVNPDNQLQPYGVVGEILIGGAGLAEEYLSKPEETDSKFVRLTLPGNKSIRAYRTGDNGWLDCDGVLHFVGRQDRQVKLRGYRIELTEIENALMSIDGVHLAAVQLSNKGAKSSLSAWYEAHKDLSESAVRAVLASHLPDYMVPEKIKRLTHMPVTHSAKVDYRALPRIVDSYEQETAREPVGPLEHQILAIWQKHIEATQPINVNSHFFEIGGDSLAAVICLNEIEQLVGQRLSLHQLVANPTISGMAEVINHQLQLPQLLVSLGDTTRQKSLFIAASGNGDLMRFQSLAKCLKGSADIHMLQPPGNVDDISINDLASLYAEKIIERGDKSIYLAGFSVGGLVALELAQQLKQKGVCVEHLFIVDTILMNMPRPLIWAWKKLSKWVARWHVPSQRQKGSRLLSAIQDHGLLMQVSAMRKYQLSKYDCPAVLIKSSAYRLIHGLLLGGWKKVFVGKFGEVEIETSHSAFFQPGRVEQLGAVIKSKLD